MAAEMDGASCEIVERPLGKRRLICTPESVERQAAAASCGWRFQGKRSARRVLR
jgi:hypothetical protein